MIGTQQVEQTTRELALESAHICAAHRGGQTVVLDLTAVTPLFDYFVITTGTSRRQMIAIADEVDRLMKEAGSSRMGTEGREGGGWLLHDYGDLLLHVFDPETRQTYDLERLWADAQAIDWEAESIR